MSKVKPRLYIVTLEPLEQRYTKQWYYYWRDEFSKYYNVCYINGKYKGDKIKKGRFLDINQTNIYKAQQIELIATLFKRGEIKDGHTFLLMDGWHYGITALKYMAQLNKINIKIFAYWHAGTWDDNDFITQAGMRDWAMCNEAGWLCACDGHFVSTKYHKKLMVDYFEHEEFKHKIHVVGFPMLWKKEIEKEIGQKWWFNVDKSVVFPHRLDPEKNPQKFDRMERKYTKYKFIKTLEHSKSKKEYYELLGKAKVALSFSDQETFGIGAVESVMLWTVPLVPDKLSYKELYPKEFRYKDMKDLYKKFEYYMDGVMKKSTEKLLRITREKIINDSQKSIQRMTKVMKNE